MAFRDQAERIVDQGSTKMKIFRAAGCTVFTEIKKRNQRERSIRTIIFNFIGNGTDVSTMF